MKALTVVGGVYHESCKWPYWDELYGSAGRAAAAALKHAPHITLISYARADTGETFSAYADAYGFKFNPVDAPQTISFDYIHCLSEPTTQPALHKVKRLAPLEVTGDVVLRFGLVESTAVVHANIAIYDPQSSDRPEKFGANGSSATRLAIVANEQQITSFGNDPDPIVASQNLLGIDNCEIVVVKAGPKGAFVVTKSGSAHVPPYLTDNVWKIGSGDVFAGMFAARWGVQGDNAFRAADLASRGVATYVQSTSLPIPAASDLDLMDLKPAAFVPGRVYIAGPFFTMPQRWLIDEAKRCLEEFGLQVFSPFHEVGWGVASYVGPADLRGLDECDRVFAILDGLDSGTLFEVGYARANKLPVHAFCQATPEEDLKMIVGSGCKVFQDFATAIHHSGWRS